jgi:DNA polymerase-3 subunit delta
MKIAADGLAARLAGRLAPVYLVAGDEPLQLGECCDAIRAAARAAGFGTREVMEAGAGFDWQQLGASAAAMSLFADRKLIDLRVPNGKPGTEGGKALVEYCSDPPPDSLLLLTLPRLDRQQQGSKWFRSVDAAGAVVQVWPVDAAHLPNWIRQRLTQNGIQPTDAAVNLLAERVEGNLLAARQEIDKLLLLHGPGPLDVEQLSAAVVDSARFDVFDLVDSALRGETARAIRVLEGLRAEGTAAPVVLWALHREAAQLARIATDVARGGAPDEAIRRAGVYARRSGTVRRALATRPAGAWLATLTQCHEADRAIKGLGNGQPWLSLASLVVAMSAPPTRARA